MCTHSSCGYLCKPNLPLSRNERAAVADSLAMSQISNCLDPYRRSCPCLAEPDTDEMMTYNAHNTKMCSVLYVYKCNENCSGKLKPRTVKRTERGQMCSRTGFFIMKMTLHRWIKAHFFVTCRCARAVHRVHVVPGYAHIWFTAITGKLGQNQITWLFVRPCVCVWVHAPFPYLARKFH